MLDEQSIQLPRPDVADLERADLQNVTGFLESGESGTKHDSDSARSRLATEMDRIDPDLHRDFHALLPQGFSPANGVSSCHRETGARGEVAAGHGREVEARRDYEWRTHCRITVDVSSA